MQHNYKNITYVIQCLNNIVQSTNNKKKPMTFLLHVQCTVYTNTKYPISYFEPTTKTRLKCPYKVYLMFFHMNFPVFGLHEGFVTHVTLVGSFSGMDSHVSR